MEQSANPAGGLTIREAIGQHKEIGDLMRDTVLTLLRSFDSSNTRFFASFQQDVGGMGPPRGERDTAIALTAIESAGKSTMDLSPEARCPDLTSFLSEVATDPVQKGYRPIRYEDYRKHVFQPCLENIAGGLPDNILLKKSVAPSAAGAVKPFMYREAFTCALILRLLDRYSSGSTYQKVYVSAVEEVLSSLTTPYAPHYVFGGASLNKREPHAFISYYCLRALRDTVDTLKQRQAEHLLLAEILDEIESWHEPDSRARLSYDKWDSFKDHFGRKLKSITNAIGLDGVVAVLKEAKLDFQDRAQAVKLADRCAQALSEESGPKSWLDRFESFVLEEVGSGQDEGAIDQEMARRTTDLQQMLEEIRKPAPPTGQEQMPREPGDLEIKMARKYAYLSGLCWKRAFFVGMLHAIRNVRHSFQGLADPSNLQLGRSSDAANEDVAHDRGARRRGTGGFTIADAVRDAGRAWGDSAQLTERYIARLAKWAEAELYRQLSLDTARFKTNFDPPQLAFALYIYSSESKEQNSDLIRKGLEILFTCQAKDGTWSAGAPLDLDREVSAAVLVGSIEVINALMPLLRKSGSVDHHRPSLEAIYNWLRTNRREINIPHRGASGDPVTTKLEGWSSDKAVESGRIDVWMSAIALQFLSSYREVLQEFISRKCLEGYDQSSPSQIRWNDLIDPQLEIDPRNRITTLVRELYIDPFLQKGSSRHTSMILYGPPGTAKTTFAKALAAELGWRLVTITPSDFVKQGVEQSERMARELFENLRQVREVVVLFDEIDEMLRERSAKDDDKQGIGILRFLIPGMLPKLQDLKQYGEKQKLIFIIATNYFDRLDPAIRRRGRIDECFLVPPPDLSSRRCQLEDMLQERGPSCDPHTVRFYRRLASCLAVRTAGWVRKDLESVLERAIREKELREQISQEKISHQACQEAVDRALCIWKDKWMGKWKDKQVDKQFEWTDYALLRKTPSEPGFLRALIPWQFYARRPNAAEEARIVTRTCWPPDEWHDGNSPQAFTEFVEAIINPETAEHMDVERIATVPKT